MKQAPPGFPFQVKPLGDEDRAAFSCGEEALDKYFKNQAGQDMRKRVAAVFVLIDKQKDSIAGYYSLSSTAVRLDDLPDKLAKRLPKYPLVPATLLGRLAVDANYRGQRLGEYLLVDALQRSLENSSKIASAAIVVDAKNEAVKKFYLRYGFIGFPDQPSRLFLPMATVEQLLK